MYILSALSFIWGAHVFTYCQRTPATKTPKLFLRPIGAPTFEARVRALALCIPVDPYRCFVVNAIVVTVSWLS